MKLFYRTLLSIGIICITGEISSAQTLKDLLNKAAESETLKNVVETVTGTALPVDVTGTWTYSGTAVKLESDDLLKSTAASLAAGQIEEKLDGYVSKIGVRSGTFSFTFNADLTFSVKVKNKTFNGTYTISEDYKTLTLQFGKMFSMKPFTAGISATSSQLDLLFEADRLLDLIGKLTSSSSNSTLSMIGNIVNQYDGMKLGLELKK